MSLMAVVMMATIAMADAPRPITKAVGARPTRSSPSKSLHLSAAAARLGKAAGVDVRLAPGVPDPIVQAWFVIVTFEYALWTLVNGECLDYVATDDHSVLITRSNSGEKRQLHHGANVVVWPTCTDGYRPPRELALQRSGLELLPPIRQRLYRVR
jgi:hypothetical protein